MPHLDIGVLDDLQAKGNLFNQKIGGRYGALNVVKDGGQFVQFLPPSVREELSTISGARSINIPVLLDQAVTVTTTPGFNIPVNLGETQEFSYTAVDIFSGMRLYPAAFKNNVADIEDYRSNVLDNILKEMAIHADNACLQVMSDRASHNLTDFDILDGSATGSATVNTANVITLNAAAQTDVMFRNFAEIITANELDDMPYGIVTNPGGLALSEAIAAKNGSNQAIDLEQAQGLMSPDRRYKSNQLTAAGRMAGYLVRDGDLGIVENFPYDYVQGTELGGTKKWSVSNTELPHLRMRANIYTNAEATDATALVTGGNDSNLTMTTFEEMAIWARFYIIHKPMTTFDTTGKTGIIQIAGTTA